MAQAPCVQCLRNSCILSAGCMAFLLATMQVAQMLACLRTSGDVVTNNETMWFLQVEAIDNEHREHLNSEADQQWSASMSVGVAGHPIAKFGQGNKATLWDEPRAAGVLPMQNRQWLRAFAVIELPCLRFSCHAIAQTALGRQVM